MLLIRYLTCLRLIGIYIFNSIGEAYTAPLLFRKIYNSYNVKEDYIMTYRQIETSREIRQWFKGIIIPAAAGLLYLDYKYPDLKNKVVEGVKSKFKKKEEKE